MTNLPCNLFQDLIYFIALLPDQTLIELSNLRLLLPQALNNLST